MWKPRMKDMEEDELEDDWADQTVYWTRVLKRVYNDGTYERGPEKEVEVRKEGKRTCPKYKAHDQFSEAATTAVMTVDKSDVLLAESADGKSDWILKSGSAYHLCRDREMFSTYAACESSVRFRMADGKSLTLTEEMLWGRKTEGLYRLEGSVQTGEATVRHGSRGTSKKNGQGKQLLYRGTQRLTINGQHSAWSNLAVGVTLMSVVAGCWVRAYKLVEFAAKSRSDAPNFRRRMENNLHELWSLLNFLLPEIFSSAETFDEWFQISGENDQQEVVQQLHKVLRPFLLRRLKSDVEKGLPPKKETILKVGMSQMQKQYYRALLQKDLEVVNAGGERKRLLNIAMQLRKCCNHPYLFQGAEPGPPYTTGDHLISNAGKMVLLDKLLPKLKDRDSRVLIFSQMTRLLDILEDYLMFCGYQYCRIDGNTGGDDRDASIDAFNKPGSEKFVFLLSTRAGGLGINLATADVVILYDSDWNPQVDLQAQDRAHRIGQKKEVQVFRFCTEYTIEEKVIERAYKKLALDALVIQQGRLAEQKTVNKDELLQMVRFGAEMVFTSKDSTITDEDIDRIIAKGEEATAELDAKMKKFTEDAIKFKMDDTADLYDFDDDKDDNKTDFKKIVSDNWLEPPKRERKRNYSESEYFKQTMRQSGPARPKEPRIPRMPQLHDFQFFNTQRLSELYEKEVRYLMQTTHQKNQLKDTIEVDEPEELGDPLTAEEQEEKERLLDEGFSTWSRRDFNTFIRACEKYGRSDVKSIASEMEGKSEEVERYAKVFKERYKELNDYDRIIKNIERGEARISRKDEIMKAIGKKLDRYKNPWLELKIQYGQNKGKLYNEECDRFMICMVHKLGYGNWDELKAAFRTSPLFRFDWFVKSRTTQELARRCDTLIRLVERENQEFDERERQARKEKKMAKNATPSKRALARQAADSPPLTLKKRKQVLMDDYVSSVCLCPLR
ncbi:chromatin remodeling factor17 [Actinidia rufa]|uniref:Chromatin remodeling factor17 n=1 Tax=Actinidia rufa TaxID=165716 RepID=A0A7J0GTD2_9ERIC|nr:chromatin remodeling factor17 [Actinidia rufa]